MFVCLICVCVDVMYYMTIHIWKYADYVYVCLCDCVLRVYIQCMYMCVYKHMRGSILKGVLVICTCTIYTDIYLHVYCISAWMLVWIRRFSYDRGRMTVFSSRQKPCPEVNQRWDRPAYFPRLLRAYRIARDARTGKWG